MKPPRPQQPMYLARETYRKRRLMDAARLLPVVGAFLFAIPVLWAEPENPASETAREAIFVFLVWAGLIAGAFFLSRRLALTVEGTADAAPPRPDTPVPPAASSPPPSSPGGGEG